MHEIVARLHTVAIDDDALDAADAVGEQRHRQRAERDRSTETTETSAPSCLSDRPQSAFMYGNSETMTWRST